ncbi:MAG: S24 family peptidase [Arsenophonus sp. NEOnobi-MAG3]
MLLIKLRDIRIDKLLFARIDNEVTLKRFKQAGNKVELIAKNHELKLIILDFRIQIFTIKGVAIVILFVPATNFSQIFSHFIFNFSLSKFSLIY